MLNKILFIILLLSLFLLERLQKIFYVGFFDLYPGRVVFLVIVLVLLFKRSSLRVSGDAKIYLTLAILMSGLSLISALFSIDVAYSVKKSLDIGAILLFPILVYLYSRSVFGKKPIDVTRYFHLVAVVSAIMLFAFQFVYYDVNVFGTIEKRSLFGIEFSRRQSLFSDPNFMGVFATVLFAYFISRKNVNYILLFLVITSILLSGSKAALLFVTITLLYVKVYKRFVKPDIIYKVFLTSNAVISIFLMLFSLTIIDYARNQNNEYLSGMQIETSIPRLLAWYSGFMEFKNKPIIGVGPGNIVNVDKGENTSDISQYLQEGGFYGVDVATIDTFATHSTYLELLYENGIVFFILLIYSHIVVFRNVSANSKFQITLSLMCLNFTAGIALLSYNTFYFSALLGLLLYAKEQKI